jgi:acyl-CoA thioester hydrolase
MTGVTSETSETGVTGSTEGTEGTEGTQGSIPVQSEPTSRPYLVDVPLRWSDMDAYGHVNNVQFLRLLEDARVIGFREWFGQDRSLLDRGVLVARHEIEYLAPLTFRHAPITVVMWATKISGASFDLAYLVRDPENYGQTLYARAETTLVAYDFATAAPRRMVELERAILRRVSGEPVSFRRRGR